MLFGEEPEGLQLGKNGSDKNLRLGAKRKSEIIVRNPYIGFPKFFVGFQFQILRHFL